MGTITKKGYRRIAVNGRQRMEHDVVWERSHGPIPAGFQVHHVNEDKLDNRLDNLELLDPLTHKRLHGGCVLRDGIWWKPCRKCGTMKPIGEYYGHGPWIQSWCKACQISNSVNNKRKRRDRRACIALAA